MKMEADRNLIINKTMDRRDLFVDSSIRYVAELNDLIRLLQERKLSMSSWVGTLPTMVDRRGSLIGKSIERFIMPLLGSRDYGGERKALAAGVKQRINYKPMPGSANDLRFPWFLYWEIIWVLRTMKPYMHAGMRCLDAGGASSLFTCYLAHQGFDIHSVDLNKRLRKNGDQISKSMKWKMKSYHMDIRRLDFPERYFDHAFSICVFKHLDYDIKRSALAEIARCLKPGGMLGITFDYRNPAPGVAGYGKDTRPRNAIRTLDDIERNFLGVDGLKLIGNQVFQDNGESYLVNPLYENQPYTFGAIFLKKE